MYYVGIDWADDKHDIHILDDQGQTVKALVIPHKAEGFQTLLDRAQELTPDKDQVVFAMETSQHLLVDALLDAGYTVYPVNPKQAERARERYSVAGAKSDAMDAKGLARMLRNDIASLAPFRPSSDLARELKLLTRDRRALVRLNTQLANQLTSCLKAYYPRALELFGDIDSQISLAFLQRFPTPAAAARLTFRRFQAFLKAQHYPAPAKTQELFQTLHQAQLPVEPFVVTAKSKLMLVLVSQLLPLAKQIKDYDRAIAQVLATHPDQEIFQSLPGGGEDGTVVPRLLAELGDRRDRYPQVKGLRCEAGTAPITKASGQSRYVHFRRACNKHLRDAMQWFAFNSLRDSLWAQDYYHTKRRQGKDHHEALRMLANLWLKIIFAMWRDRKLYSEDQFLANRARQALRHKTSQAA